MPIKTDPHANLHSLRNRRQAIAAMTRQLIDDWDRLPTLGNRSKDKKHELALLRQALAVLGTPSLRTQKSGPSIVRSTPSRGFWS